MNDYVPLVSLPATETPDVTPLLVAISPRPGLRTTVSLVNELLTRPHIAAVSAEDETPRALMLRVQTSAPERLPLDLLAVKEPRFTSLVPEEDYLQAQLATPSPGQLQRDQTEPDTYDPEQLEQLALAAEGFGASLGETIDVLRSALASLSTSMPDLAGAERAATIPANDNGLSAEPPEQVEPHPDPAPVHDQASSPVPLVLSSVSGAEPAGDHDTAPARGGPAVLARDRTADDAAIAPPANGRTAASNGASGAQADALLPDSRSGVAVPTADSPESVAVAAREPARVGIEASEAMQTTAEADELPMAAAGPLLEHAPDNAAAATASSDVEASIGHETAGEPLTLDADSELEPQSGSSLPQKRGGRRGGTFLIVSGLLVSAAVATALVAAAFSSSRGDSSPDPAPASRPPATVVRTAPATQSSAASTPVVAITPPPVAAGETIRYSAKAGEDLQGIANWFGAQLKDLLEANGIPPGTATVTSDRELIIPRW